MTETSRTAVRQPLAQRSFKTKPLPTIKGLYFYKGKKTDLDHETLAYVEGVLFTHEARAKKMIKMTQANDNFWEGYLEAIQSLRGTK